MGGKSSGSSYTPYEKKDNLKSTQYVRILDLLGEGPLSGWGNGESNSTDFLKSVYLDDTPLVSETGVENFKGVKVSYAVGTEDQLYLPEFGTTENSVAVGTEVKQGIPITRTVDDSQVDRVIVSIRTGAMVSVSDKGDQDETEVNLTVDLMKDGAVTKSQHVRIRGKTSDHFFRDVELTELPETPFQIRVSRSTADSTTSKVSNQTYFASYVEIIDAKLSYPNSAVVGIEFDSELFGANIPTRNYFVKGLQVKVPSNYDPETRTYDGFWDGTFKLAFSNNPAWVFYDLVTAKRYGLGRKISSDQVDKWALYTVAQYCDQMVEDGKGGFEPRFTCNAYITDMRQAYEILQDLVSCFRGMYVWDGQNVTVSIDRPSDPVALYTNSNVVEGVFTYSSAPLNTIATAVQIQYVDADDAYRTKTEYVSDDKAIKRYGLNVKRVTSFGCTSRSQAIRTGKWLLETSRLERQSVTFTVGRSGLKHLPFDIIQVADNQYAGVEIAGRIADVQSALVTLDREVTNITGRVFNYLGSDGQIQSAEVVQQVSPNTLRLDRNITPHESATFFLRSSNLGTRYFRALTISENSGEGTYTISAIEHVPEKEAVVDNGITFEPLPNTVYTRLPQITGAQVQQNGEGVTIVWSGSGDTSGVTYQVKVFRGGLLMDTYNDLTQPTLTLSNLRPGDYRIEIRSRNKNGQWSEPEIREFVIDYNITTLSATPELFAVRLDWTLPNTAGKGYSTEIWYSEEDDFVTAEKLADVAVPTTTLTHSNLELMQKYYYWARIRDANGYTGEPSESVWCGPSTDPKLIVEYLEGKVDEKMLADGTITIAKFARSIVPPRIVEELPELPDMEYPEGSIVTLGLGGLYQNVNGEWKPMIDTEALMEEIDSALGAHIENIPLPVDTVPTEFNGRNHIIYDGALYTWNGTVYVASGIDPALEANIPKPVDEVPEEFNGSNHVVVNGEMYSWDGEAYRPQFDQSKVDEAVQEVEDRLKTDVPYRVNSIPTTFNGYNNLVLASTGQLYAWNGSAYVAQFDENAVSNTIAQAIADLDAELKVDTPQRVTSIPSTHNGYNHLVLISTGQMYSWNGSSYVPQFDKVTFENELKSAQSDIGKNIPQRVSSIPTSYNGYNQLVLESTGQLYSWNGANAYKPQFDFSEVEGAINITKVELSEDIPQRVTSIPTAHNGFNNLVLQSTGQLYAWNGTKYAIQFDSASVTAEVNSAVNALSVDVPKRVTSIPTTHNGFNNLILSSTGQMYSWNGSKYVVQFDQSAVNDIVTQIAQDLVDDVVYDLAEDIPKRVNTIPTAHNGSNNLVLASTGQVYAWDGSKYAVQFSTTLTQDVINASTIQGTKIADGSIQTAKLAANSVTASQIAAGAITTDKLSANAVTAAKIAAGAVTATHIAVNAVSAGKIAAKAVVADNIAANAVTADKIAANAVTAAKVAAGAITADKIAASAITADKLAAGTITTDKLYVSAGPNLVPNPIIDENLTDWKTYYNGDKIEFKSKDSYPSAGLFSNVIKLVNTNKDTTNSYSTSIFTGGGVWPKATSGTLVKPGDVIKLRFKAFHNDANTSDQLRVYIYGMYANDTTIAIGSRTLEKSQMTNLWTNGTTFEIQGTVPDGVVSVRAYFLAVNTPTGTTGQAGSSYYIANVEMFNMTTSQVIVDGAITASKIAANAISANHIVAGTITSTELSTNSVTADKIAANAVTSVKISANAVSAGKIAANAVSADSIAANSISTSHIVAGAVSTTQLAANAVSADKIAASAVTTAKLSASAVTAEKLSANAVTADKIAAGAITADKIGAGSITTDKLFVTSGTNLIPNPGIDANLTDWKPWTTAANVTFLSKANYPNAGLTSNLISLKVANKDTENVYQTTVFSHGGGYPDWTQGSPVKTGDLIRLRFKAYKNGGVTVDRVAAYIYGLRVDNTAVALRSLVVTAGEMGTLSSAATVRSLEVTIPDGVVSVRAYFLAQNNTTETAGGAGGTAFIGDVEMYNMTTSGLIVDGAITTDKLDANAVTAAKIAANAISANHISAGSIGTTELAANAVTAAKIAAGTITAAEIAASTITGAKIAANTISASNIAAATITAAEIAASTITGAKIATNTISASNIAAATITANEIAANTITGNKIAARTIDAGRIVTGAITANEIAANAITTAKIAAGAIGADQIAARAISTDKLLVGMSDNLVPDPMFDGGFGAWTQPHNPSYSSVLNRASLMIPNSAPAVRGVRFAAPVGGSVSVSVMSHATAYTSDLDAIAVSGKEEYWLSVDMCRGGSSTLGTFVLAAHFRLQDGSTESRIATSVVLANTTAAVWTRVSGKMVVPDTAVKMRLYIYATGYAGNVDICNPAIYRRSSGDLIVDGAITADKIAANSVTSAKILAGSIQAAHIAAGTITGDRIAANQTLSAPNISGGSINIASGKFSVTTAGVVSIKSGTSGERMEITNDAIKVYDSSNRVRVILGKLS